MFTIKLGLTQIAPVCVCVCACMTIVVWIRATRGVPGDLHVCGKFAVPDLFLLNMHAKLSAHVRYLLASVCLPWEIPSSVFVQNAGLKHS